MSTPDEFAAAAALAAGAAGEAARAAGADSLRASAEIVRARYPIAPDVTGDRRKIHYAPLGNVVCRTPRPGGWHLRESNGFDGRTVTCKRCRAIVRSMYAENRSEYG